MNPKKGGSKRTLPSSASSKLKGQNVGPDQHKQSFGNSSYCNYNQKVGQLCYTTTDLSVDSANDVNWVTISRSKNRTGRNAPKQWQSSAPKSWSLEKTSGGARQDKSVESHKLVGAGHPRVQSSNKGWENMYMAPPPDIPPSLQHGWQWSARDDFTEPKASEYDKESSRLDYVSDMYTLDEDEDEDISEITDEEYLSEGFESDENNNGPRNRKKSKWFKSFFLTLDKLSIEEMNSTSRQWHCPACQNRSGGINWYRGLQPLMAHAKTIKTKRVKLHREFAELLGEELRKKGTFVTPAAEAYGKWKGLHSDLVPDKEIVWPPMVVIMNTRLQQDENENWIGMGNQELLDTFPLYNALKAQHSYGPKGHRGMSVLIFDRSPMGYLEAERLHNHFVEERRHRDAWDRHPVLFVPGGDRQLFGFMAQKEDLDIFNQHCSGKSGIKFEMKSYEDMVVEPMKQMSEERKQLSGLKKNVVEEKRNSKALKESIQVLSEKLRKTTKENRIVRQRTKLQQEQNKEEMDNQEQFYKDQINMIHEKLEDKESEFEERLQEERNKVERLQEERNKVKQSNVDSITTENKHMRKNEIERFIESQVKGIKNFEADREKLINLHEDKKAELKLRHMKEEVELEEEFGAALIKLMKQYNPPPSEEDYSAAGDP